MPMHKQFINTLLAVAGRSFLSPLIADVKALYHWLLKDRFWSRPAVRHDVA